MQVILDKYFLVGYIRTNTQTQITHVERHYEPYYLIDLIIYTTQQRISHGP